MKKRKLSLLVIIGVLLLLTSCIKAHKVSFDLGYDNKILEDVSVLKGSKVSEPEIPLREGYAFIEWQLDGEKFDFNTKITKSITLTAKWGLVSEVVLVEFLSNGGTLTEPQIIPKGSKATKPKTPTKEGYQFIGWFNEGELFDFNEELETNITLEAKWEEKTYSLTLPKYVTADQEDLTNIKDGKQVVLTITLEEGITLKELFINDVDVLNEVANNKYSFIIKENTVVRGTLVYELVEASFNSKEKVSTAISEGNINSYLNITNEGNSTLETLYSANGSSTRSIFNNSNLEIRLYPGGGNGGSIIIKLEDGYEIEKIEIETGDNAGFSINDSGNYTFKNQKEVIELEVISNVVEIKNIANATSGSRVDLKTIKIYYNKALKTEDITPPELTLNEGVNLNYRVGDVWDKEAALSWVSVWDNIDGIDLAITLNDNHLYEALIVNGVLKFDLVGTYQIIYSATDSSGNIGYLVINIKVYSETLLNLEDINYLGFNDYYLTINSSNDVITEMAYLLRETIKYPQYGEARDLYVPYEEGSDKQVVMYDYEGRDGRGSNGTYKLVPFSWGSGGYVTLTNGKVIKLEREHVWAASDMLIRPINYSKTNQNYVPYELNLDKEYDYRPDNNHRGHYSDMHNLWLSVGPANGTHSNYFYGEEEGHKANYYLKNTIFYPGEEYIGDIARILFYMTLMYPHLTLVEKTDPNAGVTNNIYYGYLEVLLHWNEIDPPSDYEIARNELIFAAQGNRNPFIDFYDDDFAQILFSYGDPNVLDN